MILLWYCNQYAWTKFMNSCMYGFRFCCFCVVADALMALFEAAGSDNENKKLFTYAAPCFQIIMKCYNSLEAGRGIAWWLLLVWWYAGGCREKRFLQSLVATSWKRTHYYKIYFRFQYVGTKRRSARPPPTQSGRAEANLGATLSAVCASSPPPRLHLFLKTEKDGKFYCRKIQESFPKFQHLHCSIWSSPVLTMYFVKFSLDFHFRLIWQEIKTF